MVPTRRSSMTPLGAVANWQSNAKALAPSLFSAVLPVRAVSVGLGGVLEPKLAAEGLIQRFTLVWTPATR